MFRVNKKRTLPLTELELLYDVLANFSLNFISELFSVYLFHLFYYVKFLREESTLLALITPALNGAIFRDMALNEPALYVCL